MTSEQKPPRRLDQKTAIGLHRALTAQGDELFQVLQDSSPDILGTALKNPHLSDDHIMALLKRRNLSEALLKTVHGLERVKSSHQLQISLVKNPSTPSSIVLSILPRLHLFELVNLCCLPGVTPDQKFAAERAILQRLPTTELGHRLTLARRATAIVVAELLKSGEKPLVESCLDNPRLREVAILQFLSGPYANAETISMIARHPKWKSRPNLQQAILKNNRTPLIWFTLLLPRLRTPEVRNLLASHRLNPAQKKHIRAELAKRAAG
jgi:hypothetical protein